MLVAMFLFLMDQGQNCAAVINTAARKHDWTTQLLQLHASPAPRKEINDTTESTTS